VSESEPNPQPGREPRRVRRRYTIADIIETMPQYMTPRAKIVTSISLRTIHYVALKLIAEKTGTSMSEVVNEILDVVFNECENSCEKITDKYIDIITRERE